MTILDLRKLRAEKWEGAKNYLESHRTAAGTLSQEDDQAYDRMVAEINDLGKEITRLEQQQAIDAELSKAVSSPLATKPGQDEATGRASKQYKDAIMSAIRTNFRNQDKPLKEGTDSEGGYLVPTELDTRIIDVLNAENVVRPLATVITTSGGHKINVAATKPTAAWVEEGKALTFGEGTFTQVLLDAHKLHVAIKVTEELLYDNAFNLENYLVQQFGIALASEEEKAFLVGTGSHQPTGMFNETGGGTKVESAKEEGIDADDIISLIYALKRPYRKNAGFILNDKQLAAIRKFKDSNGVYMWQPSYAAGEPDKLLGYPVYTSSFAPDDKIAFGDFSYYNIGDRGVRSFAALHELFAGNGMVGFVMKERVDGKLVLPEAVQILTKKQASEAA